MIKPLEQCVVLDLTRVLAGPYCSMILGDLGARIIKIEVPGIGDDSRGYGPYKNGHSAYFMSVNRNKESMTLNLKSDEGKEIFKELVQRADVLIENFRPGTMEKLGISFDELKKINPKLVYTTITGFGHTGPYSHKPAYDIIVQALGGMMSITGEKDGVPLKVGASIGDITAGLFAVIGTMGALTVVKNGGEGQHVDISMLDSQVAILENSISRYLIDGTIPKPIGNRHPSISPFCSFLSSDGYIIVAVGNDNLWRKVCILLHLEELIVDPKFHTNAKRTEHWDELQAILEPIFKSKTTDEWLELLEGCGIPCAPLQTVDQVVSDPQVLSRNMIIDVIHPEAGELKIAANPIKYSNISCKEIRQHPPLLGEHTQKILLELGYDEGKIANLSEYKII